METTITAMIGAEPNKTYIKDVHRLKLTEAHLLGLARAIYPGAFHKWLANGPPAFTICHMS
jgi:hypothetical protein